MPRRRLSISSATGSPLEHDEQKGLIVLCDMMRAQYPELELLYANPNAGRRSVWEVGRLKAEGWKAGLSDLTLPVARRGFHGMYLELKRADGREADLSKEQRWWLAKLSEQGYFAIWCAGAAAAWKQIEWYLSPDKAGS